MMRRNQGLLLGAWLIAIASLFSACGNRNSMSPEELQHKLDKVKAIEIREKLEAQGINLQSSDNPVKQFFGRFGNPTIARQLYGGLCALPSRLQACTR